VGSCLGVLALAGVPFVVCYFVCSRNNLLLSKFEQSWRTLCNNKNHNDNKNNNSKKKKKNDTAQQEQQKTSVTMMS
jgi:hypothetical protein